MEGEEIMDSNSIRLEVSNVGLGDITIEVGVVVAGVRDKT